MAFREATGTEPELLIHDLLADSSFAIPRFTGNRVRFQWVPAQVSPVVSQVIVTDQEVVMDWGERRQLRATGRFTDGAIRPIDVTWEAADPTQASVDSTGTLTANGIGETFVVARYGNWLEDTVTVTVPQGNQPDALFGENFSGDLSRWRSHGVPAPQLVRENSRQVLALEGNGRYDDGLLSPDTLDLRWGATVELDFEFPLMRVDRQRIGICLEHAEGDPPSERDEDFGHRPGQSLCLQYPAGEFERFDPLEARVRYQHTGLAEFVGLPEDFSSSTWTHLALQVRPDGVVSVVANRQFVRQVGLRVGVDTDALWRVRLYGASVDTHLYVRNLTVWRGLRYE